ncbi:hypothetical protein ACIG63_45795 [Streptomyces antimycoticus]|uniref:hypothetical protein n=1 Tax=Streptomyces antimycoticus TaxID=68175 RepID=UPI0037D8F913
MAGIAHARGLLPATKFRLARFLNEQRIDPSTGRIEGRWGTVQIDGGLTLAERYAYRYGVGVDRFWDDLKGLYRAGFAERVQAPAPGRRAVYALCLRADAIPSDLPEDLMRELRVWDLPEAEDPFEDAQYGRLTSRPAGPVEPAVVLCENPETRQLAAEFAAAPRWEHQAGSKAALVAGTIREGSKRLSAPLDLRCTAVADPDRAAEMTARVHRMMALEANGKASPLYARGFWQLVGSSTTGTRGLTSVDEMEKTKTTPSAATGKKNGQAFGDDLGSVASRVQRRVWHSWRTQLGRGEVFLPRLTPEELSRSVTGDAWSDLHHTITIALPRSTESELVELLTSNIVRYDRWGRVEFKADNLGRLAGWRLWRLINSRKDAHGYGPRRQVRVAAHVEAWDEATAEERARIRARAEQARELRKRQELARAEQALAERAERRERWGLHRYEQPDVRSWTREPEHEHQEAQAARQQIEHRSAETTYRAALARARAEKRARQARGGE